MNPHGPYFGVPMFASNPLLFPAPTDYIQILIFGCSWFNIIIDTGKKRKFSKQNLVFFDSIVTVQTNRGSLFVQVSLTKHPRAAFIVAVHHGNYRLLLINCLCGFVSLSACVSVCLSTSSLICQQVISSIP